MVLMALSLLFILLKSYHLTDFLCFIPPLVIKNSCTRWVARSDAIVKGFPTQTTYNEGSADKSAMLICGCVQQLPATQRVHEFLITGGDTASLFLVGLFLLKSLMW